MLLPLFHPIPLIHRPHQVTAPNNDKGMYRRRQFPELVEIHSSLHPSFHPSIHPSSATLHPSKFSSTMAAAESKAAMVLPSSCLWNCEKTGKQPLQPSVLSIKPGKLQGAGGAEKCHLSSLLAHESSVSSLRKRFQCRVCVFSKMLQDLLPRPARKMENAKVWSQRTWDPAED